MKVFVTGSGGQLGRTLAETVPGGVEFDGGSRPEVDITDLPALVARFAAERPGFVVNAAAYTAVDRAEAEPDIAERANVEGARNVAQAARRAGARVIHVSTDFVFDGSEREPYGPDDAPAPLGVYGRTKLAGEWAVRDASDGDAIVIRTAWLYSRFGHNFVNTMLRLMRERGTVSVVADQRGAPTWAVSLANVIWAAIDRGLPGGRYHWTDGGETTWFEFAEAVCREGRKAGLLQRDAVIHPISAAEYPTAARRPAYSVLDCSATVAALGIEQRHWTANLRRMLAEMRD